MRCIAGFIFFVALSLAGVRAETLLIPESELFGDTAAKERVESPGLGGKVRDGLINQPADPNSPLVVA